MILGKKLLGKVIGATEYIDIAGHQKVPAKIDTGADSSSIWVSNLKMKKDGKLSFTFFGENSPYYTGEIIETSKYLVRAIRSSYGDRQVRYLIKLPIRINHKEITTSFTLANRERNDFPILIGKNTLKEGGFVVDITKNAVNQQERVKNTTLRHELKKNPSYFHRKYVKEQFNTKGVA